MKNSVTAWLLQQPFNESPGRTCSDQQTTTPPTQKGRTAGQTITKAATLAGGSRNREKTIAGSGGGVRQQQGLVWREIPPCEVSHDFWAPPDPRGDVFSFK
ncbi:hypothetical protein NDU88_003103 [Pleurodeles waltl]|uniref:Uncharacterized protein n=1 Tax=Pleurodeles waltl TaxID=8319 RepID=A0AAV7VCF9_PLEWA|nr:hypothetical protein NDU88_003103 [Pleurodeles waltl]